MSLKKMYTQGIIKEKRSQSKSQTNTYTGGEQVNFIPYSDAFLRW